MRAPDNSNRLSQARLAAWGGSAVARQRPCRWPRPGSSSGTGPGGPATRLPAAATSRTHCMDGGRVSHCAWSARPPGWVYAICHEEQGSWMLVFPQTPWPCMRPAAYSLLPVLTAACSFSTCSPARAPVAWRASAAARAAARGECNHVRWETCRKAGKQLVICETLNEHSRIAMLVFQSVSRAARQLSRLLIQTIFELCS